MKNTIFLHRQNKVIVENVSSHKKLNSLYMATALKNIENLGYTFSEDLIHQLYTLSTDEFMTFYTEIVRDLKTMVGDNVAHKPMYPNFPTQVMDADEAELYLNAITHYLGTYFSKVTGLDIIEESLPKYEKEERFPLIDNTDLTIIFSSDNDTFKALLSNLMGANTSISETDKADIDWALSSYSQDELYTFLPNDMPNKENLSFVVATLYKYEKVDIEKIAAYFNTATDVLRFATAMSEGDVSLATNSSFKKFKRKERRLILSLLESLDAVIEDMLRNKNRWKRLGEILHPGEHKKRFPNTFEAFQVLRNDIPFETFNGKLEAFLENKDITSAIALLKNRAGEFARRLDHLVRLSDEPRFVVSEFSGVVENISTPVLLQVMNHFKHRNDNRELRSFFPKGNVAKLVAIENKLEVIDDVLCEQIVSLCERSLLKRFTNEKALGNVFVDARLKDYLVPFSQRSASKALRTLVRGSKIDLPEGETVRFFTHWRNIKEEIGGFLRHVDIDLSAVMYDDDFKYKEHISYTNLKSRGYNAAHSGDITSAPNGASEFIDLDIPSVLKHGGRYVVVSLNSYSGQSFVDIPECFAGWMMRQEPKSGEIFEPKTVQDKVDLTADTGICIPVILDLKERKVFWSDLALTHYPDYHNNIEANQRGMISMAKAITTLSKPNLYDLFMLHAQSRGILVDDVSKADTIFSLDEGTTPFDIEKIMSQYMT